MTANSPPPSSQFSVNRIFVVKLYADDEGAGGADRAGFSFAGQVEHAVTNKIGRFRSVAEFLAFIERVLSSADTKAE